MKLKLFLYFITFLFMRVNSEKNGSSPIFEFTSKAGSAKQFPGVMGLYQATSNKSNNFTVYKKLKSEMYIYVRSDGLWAANKNVNPHSSSSLRAANKNANPHSSFMYSSLLINGTTPKEPPSTGWKFWITSWWNDTTVQWKTFECCDEVNITSSSAVGIAMWQSSGIGKYRKIEEIRAGRFVYEQVNGDHFLYYYTLTWVIGSTIGDNRAVIKYETSSSCPLSKATSNSPYWEYYNGRWIQDREAKVECLVQNMSDVLCFTESPKPNEICKFPFRFRGKVYQSCITDHIDPDKAWCSTGEATYNGTYAYDGDKWGYCQPNCTQKFNSSVTCDIPGFHLPDLMVPQPQVQMACGIFLSIMNYLGKQELAMPLPAIIILSATIPLVILLVIGLAVFFIHRNNQNKEIVEENPIYGLGDKADNIEVNDANSIYGKEDAL